MEKKYYWIIGGGTLLGIVLLMRGGGSSDGGYNPYMPSPQLLAANTQLGLASLQAGVQRDQINAQNMAMSMAAMSAMGAEMFKASAYESAAKLQTASDVVATLAGDQAKNAMTRSGAVTATLHQGGQWFASAEQAAVEYGSQMSHTANNVTQARAQVDVEQIRGEVAKYIARKQADSNLFGQIFGFGDKLLTGGLGSDNAARVISTGIQSGSQVAGGLGGAGGRTTHGGAAGGGGMDFSSIFSQVPQDLFKMMPMMAMMA